MQPLTKAQQELFDWLSEYIRENNYAPSIREMMRAMDLKSPAPIQSRLEHLRKKGYISWEQGQARTMQILQGLQEGLPIRGAITAGAVFEPFQDITEYLDLGGLRLKPTDYGLRVQGDSMIEAHIVEGDVVIMRPVPDQQLVKNGTIVAAWVDGTGTTLKHFHRRGNRITLKPANPNYQPIKVNADEVEIQGCLVGVWRDQGLTSNL